ncbi:MAG: GNAT family N-acetyltransferase [Anaerolineae bacterium]|nr:GNAT family N-acetyltransferase [Anaerolineae bacterium]
MTLEQTHITYAEARQSLPEGFTARTAQRDDLTPVLDLINTASMHDVGAPAQSADELLNDWHNPRFDLACDSQVVITPAGQIVGYAELWNIGNPPVNPYVYLVAHPDHRSGDVERALLHWGEARAVEYIPAVPAEARFTVRSGCNVKRTDLKALLDTEGFAQVRRFLRMRIDMDAAPPDPVWPEGIRVRTIRDMGDDLHAAFLANEEAFQDHWGFMPIDFETIKAWIENDPDFDLTLHFLAVTDNPDSPDGEEIVGTCFCRPKTTEDPGMGFVNDLAVRRPWRRQGIAQALLHHCFGEFWRRGQRKVGLGVDASSLTNATQLYERVGMRPYRQFDSYEKELRPGVELSTQELED